MYRSKLEGSITYDLAHVMSDNGLHEELIGRFDSLAGFGLGVVGKELEKVSGFLEEDITPISLADFWNNNRSKIEEQFVYNPVVRRPELPGPDENRIDATFFSIVLASVIKNGDVISLENPDVAQSPLADCLGAFVQGGIIHINGPTGDGVGHHAEGSVCIELNDQTGNNLGFESKLGTIIRANSVVGKNPADHVIREI